MAVVIVIASAILPAAAKTTKWKAGATYKPDKTAKSFLDANNWDNGVPEPGDTVVIAATSYWDNPVYIGSENGTTDTVETFDVGDKGLTLEVTTSYTRMLVNFTGPGKIVKTGQGRLGIACNSSFSGGLEVQDGMLEGWGQYMFGTGEINFVATDSAQPSITSDAWNGAVTNTIRFSGVDVGYQVYSSGQPYAFGPLTATHDCSFRQTNGQLTFLRPVSAPGKTLTFYLGRSADAQSNNPGMLFNSSVDAALDLEPIEGSPYVRPVVLYGGTSCPDDDLTVGVGDCQLGKNSRWAGTNVVLRANAQKLTLYHKQNLSVKACVVIENDAKLNVLDGVTVSIRSLTVKGVAVPSGCYTKSDLPTVIEGNGSVIVGAAKRTTWIGGLNGGSDTSTTGGTPKSIHEAGNWDNGVPEPGDTLVFTNAYSWSHVALVGLSGETFDIGSKGIVIETASHIKLNLNLTGSGAVVKTGSGTLGAAVDSSHAGGTRILEGSFESFIPKLTFGTGPVELVSSGDTTPMIIANLWAPGINNKLVFSGNVGYEVANLGQAYYFYGAIESTHDFSMAARNGGFYFKGDISAPGKTFTTKGQKSDDSNAPHFYCEKSVNANILKTGNKTLFLQGRSSNPDSILTVREGTCVIDTKGSWAGTNVVVEATAAALELRNAASLSESAVVRIANSGGARIKVAANVKVHVAELWSDGRRLADGVYSARNLPTVISGNGRMKVGNPGLTVLVR